MEMKVQEKGQRDSEREQKGQREPKIQSKQPILLTAVPFGPLDLWTFGPSQLLLPFKKSILCQNIFQNLKSDGGHVIIFIRGFDIQDKKVDMIIFFNPPDKPAQGMPFIGCAPT